MIGDYTMNNREMRKHIKNGDWGCIVYDGECLGFIRRPQSVYLRRGIYFYEYYKQGNIWELYEPKNK